MLVGPSVGLQPQLRRQGQTAADSVTVPLGIDHAVGVFTTSTTDLVIDLNEMYVSAS